MLPHPTVPAVSIVIRSLGTLRRYASILVLGMVVAGCGGGDGDAAQESITPSDPTPAPLPRASIEQMKYVGSFRLNPATFGESRLEYATGTLAYNPDKHSLFIVGFDPHQAIAEFPVVEPLIKSNANELNISNAPLQPYSQVLGRANHGNTQGIDKITGMAYINGQLIVNAESWYDASGTNTHTTLVARNAASLSSSVIEGYYSVAGAARAAGYIAPVPTEYQEAVGSAYFMGWSTVFSIISRYSIGPSMYQFDVQKLLTQGAGPVSSRALMSFSMENPIAPGASDMNQNPPVSQVWNGITRGVYGFIIPQTKTFMVIGTMAGMQHGYGYKITQDNGNVCGGPCPYVASDVYNAYWLFDMDEILAAPNVHSPRPYAYGRWDQPFDLQPDGQRRIILGGSFDSQTNRLYLSIQNVIDANPVINVFEFQK